VWRCNTPPRLHITSGAVACSTLTPRAGVWGNPVSLSANRRGSRASHPPPSRRARSSCPLHRRLCMTHHTPAAMGLAPAPAEAGHPSAGRPCPLAWTPGDAPDVNMGEPGCPTPPPGGRVWAGLARTQGDGGNRVVPRPRPREGVGGPGPCAGGWGNRVVPRPRPREGLGGLRPSKKNLCSFLFVCGGAAWRAEVTIARSVLPPSQPPPAGGRRRVPAPAGGGSGRGPSPRPRSRGAGGTPAGPGRFHRAWCAMRMTVSRDHEGTRFSHPPARGRASLSRRGLGESRFPHTPTRWEGLGGPRPPRKYLRGS